jgi:hypothetical protein|tara:strand:+ start:120 stop:506 length:387 start_codon:yes stop_codon:yes gene_type:complete
MKYRSNLERNIAKALEESKIVFEYEAQRLSYQPKVRTYLPDFYIPDDDFYIEGKGYFHNSQERTRHLLIREQLGIDVKFVFGNSSNRIGKGSKMTYANWCDKHNFDYSDERPSKKWFSNNKGKGKRHG